MYPAAPGISENQSYGFWPTAIISFTDGKKPAVPLNQPPSPNARPKPTAQYSTEQRPKISTFLPAMWPAFFIRVRPASRKAKPACMNITSTAAMTTQMVLAAISRSEFLGTGLHLLQGQPGSVVGDVRDRCRPDDPVARL